MNPNNPNRPYTIDDIGWALVERLRARLSELVVQKSRPIFEALKRVFWQDIPVEHTPHDDPQTVLRRVAAQPTYGHVSWWQALVEDIQMPFERFVMTSIIMTVSIWLIYLIYA